MPLARSAVGTDVPRHLVTRPALPAHAIDRPRLWALLSELVISHRVTTVVAPAGFGKTSALSGWADRWESPVGWLSLTQSDQHPERLRRALEAAAEKLTTEESLVDESMALDRAERDTWPVLVIDDLQFARGEDALGALRDFIGRTDLRARIVLSTRAEPNVGLARLLADGELARLGPGDLALTRTEVREAARTLGRELDDAGAERLRSLTGGWPVAVRLALISTDQETPVPLLAVGDAFPQLADYLVENVLSQLPDHLADFVLQACTCDWLTGQLAADLTNHRRATQHLEQAAATGLPLERISLPGRDPIYRWHPVMAQAGRALLLRRDPALARSLHRRAADLLRVADPYEAAAHALAAREPAMAARLLKTQWLAGVLRGDSELVNALCGRLPAPWSDDPEVLTIRALCLQNRGDSEAATRLARRAAVAATDLSPAERTTFEVTARLSRLFLADEEDELAAACDDVEAFLDRRVDLDGALHACAVLLVGWSRLRLRHGPDAARLLEEATTRCRAEGLDDLADRARTNRAFMLAYSGDFAGARQMFSVGHAPREATWRRDDGAVESFAKGWMWFWSGDHVEAFGAFRDAIAAGGAITSVAPLARLWLVHTVLARRDAADLEGAERLLAEVPDTTIQGLPWGVYKLGAQAGIAAFRGDVPGALSLLEEMSAARAFIPAARVLAAELFWTSGRSAEARAQVEPLLTGTPDYIRIGAMVLTALCRHREGDSVAAHALLEESLGLGAALGVRRPFQRFDPHLTEFLSAHAALGTRHEGFLASLIAEHQARSGDDQSLSAREREIVGYLATTLSAAEIREALFISQNTLKTHLKSIYRKLGVDNRRDAVRAAQGPPSS